MQFIKVPINFFVRQLHAGKVDSQAKRQCLGNRDDVFP